MEIINMHQAKSELSRLVRDVLEGKRVQIARHGQPVVELHSVSHDQTMRVPGILKGKIRVSDDFYDLSDELYELFELKAKEDKKTQIKHNSTKK